MNVFLLKNILLIAGILGTTAVVPGPVHDALLGSPGESADNISAVGNITADSIYQLGSNLFYKEINKPGNEYLCVSVEGYSENLVQDDESTASFNARWQEGVTTFKAGYTGCMDAYLMLTEVPDIRDQAGKNTAWEKMRSGREDISRSVDLFAAAKSHASPGSSPGFTIGLVLPRIEEMKTDAENAELASIQATLADKDHDEAGFNMHLKEVGAAVNDMKRMYPELQVLSKDF